MVRDKEVVAGSPDLPFDGIYADDRGWRYDPDDPLKYISNESIKSVLEHPESELYGMVCRLLQRRAS